MHMRDDFSSWEEPLRWRGKNLAANFADAQRWVRPKLNLNYTNTVLSAKTFLFLNFFSNFADAQRWVRPKRTLDYTNTELLAKTFLF